MRKAKGGAGRIDSPDTSLLNNTHDTAELVGSASDENPASSQLPSSHSVHSHKESKKHEVVKEKQVHVSLPGVKPKPTVKKKAKTTADLVSIISRFFACFLSVAVLVHNIDI